MNNVLKLNNVSKSYNDGIRKIKVFEGLNLELNKGEFLAVNGESGIGKSTLLNLIGLLDVPDGGDIILKDRKYSDMTADDKSLFRNSELGFVFQFHHLLPEFDVRENVAIPYTIGNGNFDQGMEKASSILEAVGLGDRLTHYPSMLSGGERQRAAIARALVNSPSLLLMDEPTGNLDPETGDNVMDYIETLREMDGFSCIIVTHNMKIAGRCDRIFSMSDRG